MPRIDPLQESFVAGEISPRLWGRTSLDLYKAGLGKCENFLVYPHGGVTKRGGFRYVAEVKDSTKTTILQKFNYKDEFQYVFEFGHNYIRVFRNQAAVLDGAVPYEIVTTYTENEVQDLRFTQDEEKLFIVHKDHPPAELIRTDHNNWTLQNINFSNNGVLTVDTIVEPEKNVWTSRDAAAIVDWQSICWSPELKIFCAVSNTGTDRVMTSPDGVIWSIRIDPVTLPWSSVCWSPDLAIFVAVARDLSTSSAMTSPDGIIWTSQATTVGRYWNSVCWSPDLSLFVAVADGPTSVYQMMTSPNGINWTLRELDTSTTLWTSVCWSPELSLFVAVGYYGAVSFRVMTSSNGINWTRRSAATASTWQSVCWNTNATLFVAVANSGLISERIMTSPDGINWTSRTAPVNNSWREVCWNSKLGSFVAVSDSGTTDKVMISYDGITWALQVTPEDNDWTSVCYSPELNLLVAVANSGAQYRVMTYSLGFTNGTYEEVELISDEEDDGRGAEATIVIANYSIDTITITKPGATYKINDTLSIDPTDIGGSAYVSEDEDEDEDAGLTTCDVATLTENDLPDEWGPGVATVDTIVDQSNHDNGTYEDVELSGGSGSGVKATVIVESNSISSITITEQGSLYAIDDTLTISTDTIGGTDSVTCDVATLTIENYPTLIWFFEQRFWLAATPNESNMVWGSRSADYFNFYLGEGLDNEGIAVSIKGATKLLWAVDGSAAILLGAHNGEFKLASNSLNEALTPSNIRPVQITNYGNAFIPVIQINADILFVQKGLRIVRRLRYEYTSNSYVAIPANLISEHITESGIVGVAYSNEPNSIYWAFRTDGVLIAMTYDPDNKIFGWHRHPIGGTDVKVQSIVNIDGATNVAKDELWAIIERTIGEETVKYVEFLVPEGLSLEDDLEDAFFVDSGITKTGSGFTTFDGLGHLEGEEVRIFADGAVQAPKIVSGNEITLDIAVDKAHAGLAYNASIETLPLEGGNPIGTAQAKIKRISSMVLRLYRSLTFYMGDVLGNEDVYPFGPPEEMDSAIPLFTGDTEEQAFPGGYDTQGKVRIASYDPVPLTILAIMYELRVKD